MADVLALGTDTQWGALKPPLKKAHIRFSTASTTRALSERLGREMPDVVLVDVHLQKSGEQILRELWSRAPGVPVVAVLPSGFAPGELARFVARAEKLASGAGPRKGAPPRGPGTSTVVRELHDPTSGRLDALRVATFFGLKFAELARLLGPTAQSVSPQAMHKTPDSPALQGALVVFARAARALLTLFETAAAARMWLNAPNPELDGARPVELLRKKKARVVVDLLEDALLGHPG